MKMIKLIFGTTNSNKVAEIKNLLPEEFSIGSLSDVNITRDLPENQDTIKGNAIEKVEFLYNEIQENCFAEDTGLEVHSLNGEPGVHSARYAGDEKNDQKNMDLLLEKLGDSTDREAQFRTVIALYFDNNLHTFEGIARGRIAYKASGSEGFGYDPIFVPAGHASSFANMKQKEKNATSHRAKATEKLIQFLRLKIK